MIQMTFSEGTAAMGADAYYIHILDELPSPVWRSGPDARWVHFNQSWLAFTGRTREQALLEGWAGSIHPDDQERILRAYRAAFEARQPFEVEYRLRHQSGEYRWMRDVCRPFYGLEGAFEGYIGTSFELTEHKQLARAAQESEVLFEGLFEHVPDAVIAIDQRGRVARLNDQAEKMFGYSRSELIGKPIEMLMPTGYRSRHQRHVSEFMEQPRVRPMGQHLNLLGQRKDGSLFPVDINLGPLETDQGTLVLATIRDISERKQAENELRLYRDHLEELVELRTTELQEEIEARQQAEEALQRYADQLAASNRELQSYASIVSHDLQEPLRKIQAFGERLATRYGETLQAEGQDYLRRMLNSSARMQHMLNDLLTYSRVTTRPSAPVRVPLQEVLAEVLSDLELRLEETGGKVAIEPLPEIEADPLQMRQLFQNLIGNALKFHRPDVPPEVQVTAEMLSGEAQNGGERVQIVVQDNGIGFEETYTDRIFLPFQRLHERDHYEGNGIGLAICRKIVERHGGELTAHSRPGEGAKFIVTLPVKQEE